MDFYSIEAWVEGERIFATTVDGDELDVALIQFLRHLDADNKVVLTYTGEMYEPAPGDD